MIKMTLGEERFWQAAAAQKHTREIRLAEIQAPDALRDVASEHRSHVYALDTSTGRLVSATMGTHELTALAAHMRDLHGFASGPVALRSAALAILECQDSYEARQELMTIVAAACTCSMLYQQVSRTTELEGHWIVYAYKLANGDALARVAFAPVDALTHMSDKQITSEVVRMISADMANQAHPLYQHIKTGGGAVLASELADALGSGAKAPSAPASAASAGSSISPHSPHTVEQTKGQPGEVSSSSTRPRRPPAL